MPSRTIPPQAAQDVLRERVTEQAALCIAEVEGLDRELSPWETQLGCDGAYRTIVWVVEAPGNALYVDARDGTLVEWATVADGPP